MPTPTQGDDASPDGREFSADEREVYDLSLEKFVWEVQAMFDELEALFDERLVWVHLNGHISTKAEWMGMLRSGIFVYDRVDFHAASVRVHGDAAVVVGRATFVVNGGKVYPLVYTEVYMRGADGLWSMTHLQTSLDEVTARS